MLTLLPRRVKIKIISTAIISVLTKNIKTHFYGKERNHCLGGNKSAMIPELRLQKIVPYIVVRIEEGINS